MRQTLVNYKSEGKRFPEEASRLMSVRSVFGLVIPSPNSAEEADGSGDINCDKEARRVHFAELAIEIRCGSLVFNSVIDTVSAFVQSPHSHSDSRNVHVDVAKPIVELSIGPSP